MRSHSRWLSSIDQPVVGAHALPHDLRRDADHVRVADAARRSTTATMAMRAASSPCCGCTHRMPASARSSASSTSRRRRGQRTRGDLLDQHAFAPARRPRRAPPPGWPPLRGSPRRRSAPRARRGWIARQTSTALRAPGVELRTANNGPNTGLRSAVTRVRSSAMLTTTKAGTWPPPDVTLASPVALRRVRKPASSAAEQIRREVDEHVALDDAAGSSQIGNVSRRTAIRSCTTQPRRARRARARCAASHAASLVSQPSVTPVPPYSSFGLMTNRSRCARRCGSRSIALAVARTCPFAHHARPGHVRRDDVALVGR